MPQNPFALISTFSAMAAAASLREMAAALVLLEHF